MNRRWKMSTFNWNTYEAPSVKDATARVTPGAMPDKAIG
jgi:hypothetical protein